MEPNPKLAKARGSRARFVAKQAGHGRWMDDFGYPRSSGCGLLVSRDKVRTGPRGRSALLRGVHRIAQSREFMSSRVSTRLAFVCFEPIRPPVLAPAACRRRHGGGVTARPVVLPSSSPQPVSPWTYDLIGMPTRRQRQRGGCGSGRCGHSSRGQGGGLRKERGRKLQSEVISAQRWLHSCISS